MGITRSAQTVLALAVGATLMFSGGGVAQAASHAPTGVPAVAAAKKADDRTKQTRGGKQGSGKDRVNDKLVSHRKNAVKQVDHVGGELDRITALLAADAVTPAHRTGLAAAQSSLAAQVQEFRTRITVATTKRQLQDLGRSVRQTLDKPVADVLKAAKAVVKADTAIAAAKSALADLEAALAEAQTTGTDVSSLQADIATSRAGIAETQDQAGPAADALAAAPKAGKDRTYHALKAATDVLDEQTEVAAGLAAQVRELVKAHLAAQQSEDGQKADDDAADDNGGASTAPPSSPEQPAPAQEPAPSEGSTA